MSDNKNKDQTKSEMDSAINKGGGGKNKRFQKPHVAKAVKFAGRCDDLSDAVFDMTDSKQKQAENYARALREIATYVGKEYKYGDDIAYLVEELSNPDIESDKPVYNAATMDNDPTEKAIWTEEVKLYVN